MEGRITGMVAPGPRLLILLACLFVPPAMAEQWAPPTEKKALEKTIKEKSGSKLLIFLTRC